MCLKTRAYGYVMQASRQEFGKMTLTIHLLLLTGQMQANCCTTSTTNGPPSILLWKQSLQTRLLSSIPWFTGIPASDSAQASIASQHTHRPVSRIRLSPPAVNKAQRRQMSIRHSSPYRNITGKENKRKATHSYGPNGYPFSFLEKITKTRPAIDREEQNHRDVAVFPYVEGGSQPLRSCFQEHGIRIVFRSKTRDYGYTLQDCNVESPECSNCEQ